MNAPLYNEVNSLAIDIVSASNKEDESALVVAYELLAALCAENENTEKDHPLQWEALGDFSDNFKSSIEAYEKGLAISTMLQLDDYSASISLALSEVHLAKNNISKAKEYIVEAKGFAKTISDTELKSTIEALARQL